MPPKASSASSSTLSKFPTLTFHYALIVLVFALAIFRFFISDVGDRHHCRALLQEGRWLEGHSSWQPQGCMLHPYKPKEVTTCLEGRHVVFIGDSTVRQVFYAAVKHVDKTISTVAEKHADRTISAGNVQFTFFWDPFLNSTKMDDFLAGRLARTIGAGPGTGVPTLAVIGSGIHYLRYPESGGISAWQHSMARLFGATSPAGLGAGGGGAGAGGNLVADEVVLMPVEQIVAAKLSPDRASSIHEDDILTMNTFLSAQMASQSTVAIPTVFNNIIDGLAEETEDGLHFSDAVTKVQAQILLNLRCNDVMPKKFPFDKTCCSQYPTPNWVQGALLAVLLLWGPLGLYFYSRSETSKRALSFFPDQKYLIPLAVFGLSVSFLFIADRTSLFLKENKQYDALTFLVLCLASLAAGWFTLKPRADKDLGFLNREQTDEWKGWMQVAILIYHYVGASKISGIYNPIRVCVAAYLFQTGYGHLTFFLKKGDFGFARVANIVVRINLLTIVLAYSMDTDYLSYYFSPLVTMWFLIIWVTMWAGNKHNDKTLYLLSKIILAALLMGFYFQHPGPLDKTFEIINAVFGTTWNAVEWRFRVALDMWVVWVGALTALAFIKIKDLRLTDRPEWPTWERYTIIGSGVAFAGFMAFELTRESKFVYNWWHPYLSPVPVLAFCVLRNATVAMRSTSSNFFAFFGRCSLETFIIQFHLFIAADTRGIIMMIPGGPLLRPVNFIITSLVFVFVSNQVASATGSLTDWICNKGLNRLPVARPQMTPAVTSSAEYVPLEPQGLSQGPAAVGGGQQEKLPNTDIDALSPSAPPRAPWYTKVVDVVKTDLRLKFVAIFCGLWLLNEIYPVTA